MQDCDLKFSSLIIKRDFININLIKILVFCGNKNYKKMKKIIIFTALLVSTTMTYAQNKNARATMEVDGVCLMCKARIEKASLNTKGVKSAIWNVKTHELKLIYDERKTNLDSIQSKILAVGHDTKNAKATDEAYATVHPCCKYRDRAIVDDHMEDEGDKHE